MNRSTAQRPAAMHIGRLSRLTGRSVHTIRWYESQQLIPGVRRDLQGRRTYVVSHVAWLELLDRLKRTDFLRHLTGEVPVDGARAGVGQHLLELGEEGLQLRGIVGIGSTGAAGKCEAERWMGHASTVLVGGQYARTHERRREATSPDHDGG